MFSSLVAYWVIGLPLGYYLGFTRGLGAFGIWLGLALSLMVLGTALLFVWRGKVKKLIADELALEQGKLLAAGY
jgi:MATE family multidrug resistance protein